METSLEYESSEFDFESISLTDFQDDIKALALNKLNSPAFQLKDLYANGKIAIVDNRDKKLVEKLLNDLTKKEEEIIK